MKNLTKYFLASLMVVASLGIFCSRSEARTYSHTEGYGPEAKRFGAGLYLGDPTGLTLKGYLNDRLAIDGIISWSFVEESFTIISDATYDFFNIPIDSSSFTLPFYAGAGVKLGFDRGGKNKDETIFGLRIPVGVAMHFNDYPIEIFIEVAPGVELAPGADFDMTGGIGARFYFF